METTPGSDIEERPTAAQTALEEALRERNRLWDQLNREQANQRELEYLRAELRAVRSSRLWRLAGFVQRAKTFVLASLRGR